jgi:hypothetical protein
MRRTQSRMLDVKVEVVSATFVASGRPEGVHDLGRFLENLNNPSGPRQIELCEPAVRPLYRATAQVRLDAPLLIRRDEIVFANFEGPYFTRGTVRPTRIDAPALLMAPPFQIQGSVSFAPGADPTIALRSLTNGFFLVRQAGVFDADGNALGEGELIVVNGGAVQMASATSQRIDLVSSRAATARRGAVDAGDEATDARGKEAARAA